MLHHRGVQEFSRNSRHLGTVDGRWRGQALARRLYHALGNQAVGKRTRLILCGEFFVIDTTVKVIWANRLVQHRAADQSGYRGVQDAGGNQIVGRRGGTGGAAGQIGQHIQAGIDSQSVALVEVAHSLLQHPRNHAFASPTIDENDGFRRVALLQDVVQRHFINTPVAHDGDRIVGDFICCSRSTPHHLLQQVLEDDPHRRTSAHQRHQRDRAAAPRGNQGGQRQTVTCHLRAVGSAGLLEYFQITRRWQGFRREHFAVVPRTGLDQALFLRYVQQRQRLQALEQKGDVFWAVAAAKTHSAATVKAASWVPLGTMA